MKQRLSDALKLERINDGFLNAFANAVTVYCELEQLDDNITPGEVRATLSELEKDAAALALKLHQLPLTVSAQLTASPSLFSHQTIHELRDKLQSLSQAATAAHREIPTRGGRPRDGAKRQLIAHLRDAFLEHLSIKPTSETDGQLAQCVRLALEFAGESFDEDSKLNLPKLIREVLNRS